MIRYINEHYSLHHSVDSLSERFNISKYYLCHQFKKQTGHTLMGYIALKRIEKAKILLSNGVSSTEAAFSVGYNSYSAFYKHFKHYTKLTPRAFQKTL